MRKIVYYVACSVDGYISGPDDDISGFRQEGSGVEKYLNDLKEFDTVIMGRNTYEFGYQYGLKPGQPAYPHMRHYIFSESLQLEKPSDKVTVCIPDIATVRSLKEESGSDIYLCGGGVFAGWLLENEMIDTLKIKLNPFIQGSGIKLFADTQKVYQLILKNQEQYDHGLQIITYEVKY
ncbi:dihydrofolate reductase family protein [Rapidithrix thailandica]|uniref:Dihydrofolate reductase family protein n=1 Tax=Rapidithrix thailandica TaxID=413964 RepID=A0AAW9S9K2_9BACT